VLNKKGDYALPFYFLPSVVLLILVLVFYAGAFKFAIPSADNSIINSYEYSDNSKLLTILQYPTDVENKTLGQLISEAYPNKKEDLKRNAENILKLLPISDKNSKWNLKINDEYLVGQRIIEFNPKPIGARRTDEDYSSSESIYFEQKMIIPIENKKTVEVILYLSCVGISCPKEQLEALA
jgi:hypothetical protein